MAITNSESNSCYSCGENEPEYTLDGRALCCECYRREIKLAYGDWVPKDTSKCKDSDK